MNSSGKDIEDTGSRAESKGEASVDVVLPSPVHAKEFPF